MFFSCQDATGELHELVFVRWYKEEESPDVLHNSYYLRFQPRHPGRGGRGTGTQLPPYAVIDLQRISRIVYVQPDVSFTAPLAVDQPQQQRFFLNHYLRCEP